MASTVETSPSQGHDEHHSPHLAHHFASPQQQSYSGKLGMWLFLVQEVLFFSGLFCAYAVYRANHPEIFVYAHYYLDTTMGAINTAVLIFSSFTMALAVRAAQKSQQGTLVVCLILTILCAFTFMGIKYVEYSHKWKDGLLWGHHYDPAYPPPVDGHGGEHGTAHGEAEDDAHAEHAAESTDGDHAADTETEADENAAKPENEASETSSEAPDANIPITPATATGTQLPKPGVATTETVAVAGPLARPAEPSPKNVQIFFGIYFMMTGLHGIHVVAGIIVLVWLLRRSIRGDFSSEYNAPVDLVGLYWHLVDLVWIYLFPLLYLIH